MYAVLNSRRRCALGSSINSRHSIACLLSVLSNSVRFIDRSLFVMVALAPMFIAGSLESAAQVRVFRPVGTISTGSEIQLEGSFVVLHEDFEHSSRYLYFLDTPAGRIPLDFLSDPPTNLTGDQVRVRGQQSGGSL